MLKHRSVRIDFWGTILFAYHLDFLPSPAASLISAPVIEDHSPYKKPAPTKGAGFIKSISNSLGAG